MTNKTTTTSTTNTTNSPKTIVIVWAPEERRTAFFASSLKADLYNVHFLLYKRPWIAPFKYPLQWLETWRILIKTRPSIIYVTNPPIFAAWSVSIYCFFARKSKFIMDTHPPAMYSRKWGWTLPLQRMVAKSAMINVTDQERFKTLFESWNASAIVLSAPLPDEGLVDIARNTPTSDEFIITVVNTFAVDEPVEPILEAARQLPDIKFHILGDTGLAKSGLIENAPQNVTFTGYMFKNHYWEQLGKSRAVMVLTTYPHSLLLGAQEGMWVNKPLILSHQPSLEEFFTKGVVFVDHSPEDIARGVQVAQEQEARLEQEIHALAEEKRQTWHDSLAHLQALIDETIQKNS